MSGMANKNTLIPGENLLHDNLGIVNFTEECRARERVDGTSNTLFVNDGGSIIRVNLNSLVRKVRGDRYTRLQAIREAEYA